MSDIVPVLAAYLLGSMPFAYLLARWIAGLDIRRAGSGNPGAANVLRTTGLGGALAVIALDVGKGSAAVVLARRLTADEATIAAAGVAAVVGHVLPIWIRFRGGKGVATACGVFAVLAPVAVLTGLALFIGTIWWTRYVSLGSVVASVALPAVAYFLREPPATLLSAVLAAMIVVGRHRSNLGRLHAGTERRLGQRA